MQVKDILIVGGGSAGWMSAAYLSRALNQEGKRVNITLVESEDVSTIGVGEATIPIMGQFFRFLGIPEETWMPSCNATYKMAIKFDRWYDGSAGDSYYHTFAGMQPSNGANISLMHYWLHQKLSGKEISDFAKATHETAHLCDAKKCPNKAFSSSGKNPGRITYAFHLDAGLMVDMLKKYAKAQGVKHVIGHIDSVQKNDQGFLTEVKTREGSVLAADLFIDCTGFHSLLLEKAMGAEHHTYNDTLLCDRAIAIATNYDENDPYNDIRGGLEPYTTATARSAGWTWKTPLRTRAGNGYVYSSNHISDDQALEEFQSTLAGQGEIGDPRFIPIRNGSMDKHWIKNCVGIGLSAGFIEPMESTGLALIQIALNNLILHFPDKSFPDFLLENYNMKMEKTYLNIRDFIILHYVLTQREDTSFWKTIKHEVVVPDTLQEKLDTWKRYWDDRTDERNMFGMYNYVSILTGMQYLPQKPLPICHDYLTEQVFHTFHNITQKGKQLAQTLPSQGEYFHQLNRIKEYKTSTF